MKEKIWEVAKKHVTREIIVTEDSVRWAENENPDQTEENKFVALQAKGSRRIYSPNELTVEILRRLREKDMSVYIHTYSDNVSSSPIFKRVERALLQPEIMDRSGASTAQAQFDLANRLKAIHGHYLSGDHLTWLSWAHSIQTADPSLQEAMLNASAPPHISRLFRSAPTAESMRLQIVHRGFRVANNVNRTYRFEINTIRTWLVNFRKCISDSLDDISNRLDSLENRIDATDSFLDDAERATIPEESEESLRFADLVTDQEDLDHAE